MSSEFNQVKRTVTSLTENVNQIAGAFERLTGKNPLRKETIPTDDYLRIHRDLHELLAQGRAFKAAKENYLRFISESEKNQRLHDILMEGFETTDRSLIEQDVKLTREILAEKVAIPVLHPSKDQETQSNQFDWRRVSDLVKNPKMANKKVINLTDWEAPVGEAKPESDLSAELLHKGSVRSKDVKSLDSKELGIIPENTGGSSSKKRKVEEIKSTEVPVIPKAALGQRVSVGNQNVTLEALLKQQGIRFQTGSILAEKKKEEKKSLTPRGKVQKDNIPAAPSGLKPVGDATELEELPSEEEIKEMNKELFGTDQ